MVEAEHDYQRWYVITRAINAGVSLHAPSMSDQ